MSFCESDTDSTEWSTVSNVSDEEEPTFEREWTSYFYIQIYGEVDYTQFEKYEGLKNSVMDEVYIRTLRMNHTSTDTDSDHWNIIPIDEAHSKVYIHRKLLPSLTILRRVADFIEEITWYHENASDASEEDVANDSDDEEGDDPC